MAAAIKGGSETELAAAMDVLALQLRDPSQRAANAPLASLLAQRLQRSVAAGLATRLLDVLSLLACDATARDAAVDGDAVEILCALLSATPHAGLDDGDGAAAVRLASAKALVNLTQGTCKESPKVWVCIATLTRLDDPDLLRYSLLALANLATGSDAVKERLVQHELPQAVARILAADEINMSLAAQALRALTPLSTASCQSAVARVEQLVAALVGLVQMRRLQLDAVLPVPADAGVSTHVRSAALAVLVNLTGAADAEAQALLLRCNVCAALASRQVDDGGAAGGGGARAGGMALKGVYQMARAGRGCPSRLVRLVDDGLLQCAEAWLVGRGGGEGGVSAVQEKLVAVNCMLCAVQEAEVLERILEGQQESLLRRVVVHVLATTPDLVSEVDADRSVRPGSESGGGGGGEWGHGEGEAETEGGEWGVGEEAGGREEEEAGEGGVLLKVLVLVMAVARVTEAGRDWVGRHLVEEVVQVANRCPGRLQGVALRVLLHLARGSPAHSLALVNLDEAHAAVAGSATATRARTHTAAGTQGSEGHAVAGSRQPASVGELGGDSEGRGRDARKEGAASARKGKEKAPRRVPPLLACIQSVMRVDAGQAQLTALKTLEALATAGGAAHPHLTSSQPSARSPAHARAASGNKGLTDARIHSLLLHHGTTEPLLECLEVCHGPALTHALRVTVLLASSSPPVRTHLVRCQVIPVLARHVSGEGERLGVARQLAWEALRSLARDSSVAPLLVKAGLVPLAVASVTRMANQGRRPPVEGAGEGGGGDWREGLAALSLLQRLSVSLCATYTHACKSWLAALSLLLSSVSFCLQSSARVRVCV